MELPDTFDAVEARVAAMLAEGASDRTSAAHTPIVATADGDVRVMVLRDFVRGDWALRFHTDARAPKVAVIRSDPAVRALIYDREAKTQLRLSGSAEIHTDGDLVEDAWAASTRFARRCYLGAAPGDVSEVPTTGLPKDVESVQPTERQLATARQNFAVLLLRLQSVDWFTLDHQGHRRAILDLQNPAAHRWVAP